MTDLTSFGPSINAVVVGATGGLGNAFLHALADHSKVSAVLALSRSPLAETPPKVRWQNMDLTDEGSIEAAAETAGSLGPLHLVIIAGGILHDGETLQPEKSWRALNAEALHRVFGINTFGPALIAKHFVPLLARDEKSVFAALSARVGSISDNELGGWYAYRASKAALNMIIKTLSVELSRRNKAAVCVSLHPGTVDTGLSAPFQRGVAEGKLFTPAYSAARLLDVLDRVTPADSGKLFAWDGQEIPF